MRLVMPWTEINAMLEMIRSVCRVLPLTIETHDRGRAIAERYKVNVYDATIAAAALIAKCEVLYSEDMQDRLLIDKQLRIRNPFMAR
jgi:predicted nucleic acid-binding protein